MRKSKHPPSRRHRSRLFDVSIHDFPSRKWADLPWSPVPRCLCQQPICQKQSVRSGGLKRRALGPLALKPTRQGCPPWGNKDAENFHELVTLAEAPGNDPGGLFMAIRFAEGYLLTNNDSAKT